MNIKSLNFLLTSVHSSATPPGFPIRICSKCMYHALHNNVYANTVVLILSDKQIVTSKNSVNIFNCNTICRGYDKYNITVFLEVMFFQENIK